MQRNPAWKVFVGGIDQGVDDAAFRQYWEQFGPVADCIVMMDRQTGRSRGFGFATMGDQDSFNKVIQHGSHEINGRWMEVKPADQTR